MCVRLGSQGPSVQALGEARRVAPTVRIEAPAPPRVAPTLSGAGVAMANAPPHAVPRPGGRSAAVRPLRSSPHRRLTGIGDVFRPLALEDLLSPLDLVAVVRMDGNQDVTFPDLPFIPLSLVLGNSKAN